MFFKNFVGGVPHSPGHPWVLGPFFSFWKIPSRLWAGPGFIPNSMNPFLHIPEQQGCTFTPSRGAARLGAPGVELGKANDLSQNWGSHWKAQLCPPLHAAGGASFEHLLKNTCKSSGLGPGELKRAANFPFPIFYRLFCFLQGFKCMRRIFCQLTSKLLIESS